MAENTQWIRDYYDAYYLSASVEHINVRRLVRRTKSSVFHQQSKSKPKQQRHTCTLDEIQREVVNMRRMLYDRLGIENG